MHNLLEFADKNITVSYRDEGELKTVTGLVTKVNAAAMLVRPKGRQVILIEKEDVASVTAHAAPAPRIKIRSMEKILTEQVRQHLADRHGLSLAMIPDGDEDAEAMHDEIDHSKLGHIHRPTAGEVAERAAALDAADTAVSDDSDVDEEED